MTTVLHEQRSTALANAPAEADALWLTAADIEAATGWQWKPEGLCHGDICLPVPPAQRAQWVREEAADQPARLTLAALWRHSGQPVVHDAAGSTWVLGTGADQRAEALQSLQAPDFTLPDLQGQPHSLSQYRGRKLLLVTWASWCGCRLDLALWQTLVTELQDTNFSVLAIALDTAEAARPWIEAAAPSYPCLIDADHHVAALYGIVNVPQAVWIDEAGRIVRPTETAGSSDAFRSIDRSTGALAPELAQASQQRKAAYLAAVRDWARQGPASAHALPAPQAAARVPAPSAAQAEAHAWFLLGQQLLRQGQAEEARHALDRASQLHPDSWAIWRQHAPRDARGLAVGEAFWARVDALGDKPYYASAQL